MVEHRVWNRPATILEGSPPRRHTSSIILNVHDVMNLSSFDGDQKPTTFSNNVPYPEIRGSNESHLSVIDVPRVFKNTILVDPERNFTPKC